MAEERQIPFDLGFNEALSRDDFLEAPCNMEAIGWVDKWPDWPFFALTVYGPPASGKSHIASVWRSLSRAEFMSPETLLDKDFVPGAYETGVVLDNADMYFGHAVYEEQLFHLYNYLKENGRNLLLTTTAPPGQWQVELPDLSSRLRSVPSVGIGAPDDTLLEAVLLKHFSDRQITVGAGVVAYITARMERSLDAARRLVVQMDKMALSRKKAITIPLAREALAALSETD